MSRHGSRCPGPRLRVSLSRLFLASIGTQFSQLVQKVLILRQFLFSLLGIRQQVVCCLGREMRKEFRHEIRVKRLVTQEFQDGVDHLRVASCADEIFGNHVVLAKTGGYLAPLPQANTITHLAGRSRKSAGSAGPVDVLVNEFARPRNPSSNLGLCHQITVRTAQRTCIAWLDRRCDPQITIVSSNRTMRQVGQVTHTEAFSDLP